jgi:hypothetical protein
LFDNFQDTVTVTVSRPIDGVDPALTTEIHKLYLFYDAGMYSQSLAEAKGGVISRWPGRHGMDYYYETYTFAMAGSYTLIFNDPVPTEPLIADYLIVAGGGGAGAGIWYAGGGGGAMGKGEDKITTVGSGTGGAPWSPSGESARS